MTNVYIACAKRTPIARLQTDLKDVEAPFLALPLLRYLMDTHEDCQEESCELLLSTSGEHSKFRPMARYLALEAGMSMKTRARTLDGGHLGGLLGTHEAYQLIKYGINKKMIVMATDSGSLMPYLIPPDVSDLFLDLLKEKGIKERVMTLAKINLKKLKPLSTFRANLEDGYLHQRMVEVIENLVNEMMIPREDLDLYAHESHIKAFKYQKQNGFDEEMIPISCGPSNERILAKDLGPRGESDLNELGEIKSFSKGSLNLRFKKEKDLGPLTKGNSAFLADGAALLYLVSEEELKEKNLKPVAKIIDIERSNYHPKYGSSLGISSLVHLLKRNELTYDDLSAVEINEDFAASILMQKKILQSKILSEQYDLPFINGDIEEKINPCGGAISLGHPFSASGMRMIVTLSHYLKKNQMRLGSVTMSGTMGESISLLLENVNF